MSKVSFEEKIPNNVDLVVRPATAARARAVAARLPRLVARDGPGRLPDRATSISAPRLRVEAERLGALRLGADARIPLGHFPRRPRADRTIGFGDHLGKPVWNEVPGEHRNPLRRLIVTQGDTEPASVEQQRQLGQTCPSLYDLRNLFQVNVEEGRHLWAMVYLLHTYFGRDGREEAEGLLQRRSGNPDKPRILQAFNEPIEDWLSFMMFTTFTDRDGKYQLLSLAESAFDPLSRTCRFMLTEEAHHMFVGQTGIARIAQRTAELVRQGKDPGGEGAIPFDMLQRYLNFWYTVSLDLFGSEVSTNGANYFGGGLKGRPKEDSLSRPRVARGGGVRRAFRGRPDRRPRSRSSLGGEPRTRKAYQEDCQGAVDKWNRVVADLGVEFRLPSERFHRGVGTFAGVFFDPEGKKVSEKDFRHHEREWLPSDDDEAYVRSLMAHPVTEPGKFASWIAAPARGINSQPVDFEYVRFNEA